MSQGLNKVDAAKREISASMERREFDLNVYLTMIKLLLEHRQQVYDAIQLVQIITIIHLYFNSKVIRDSDRSWKLSSIPLSNEAALLFQ